MPHFQSSFVDGSGLCTITGCNRPTSLEVGKSSEFIGCVDLGAGIEFVLTFSGAGHFSGFNHVHPSAIGIDFCNPSSLV